MKVESCPQCGAPATVSARTCAYCKAEFFVTSLAYLGRFERDGINKYINHYKELVKAAPDDPEGHLALGLCYLQLKLYDLANKILAQAIEVAPDLADPYYYYGLTLIKGRRPKTLSLNEVRKIEEYLNTAMQLDPTRAKFNYLAAILKYDYYALNGIRHQPPSWEALLVEARSKEHEPDETERLLESVLLRDEEFTRLIRRGRF